MMYLKITGAVLVILSSSLLGLSFSSDVQRRIVLWSEFRNLLCVIRSGIEYNRLVMPEILECAVTMVKGEAGELARVVAEGLMEEEKNEFFPVWEEAVHTVYKDSPIGNELEILREPGKVMGLMDSRLRISGIDASIGILEEKIKTEQAQMPEKCRIRRNLGFLAGLFVTIVLM